MLLNIFLAIFAIIGAGILWYRISHKIPELVAMPDEVIIARLNEDSAQVRIFLLHIGTFWREPRYQEAFWRFCEKTLYRAHIVLMRTDNALAMLLRRVRNHAGSIAESIEPEEPSSVAQSVREKIAAIDSRPELEPASSPRKTSIRIREVRPRKKSALRAGVAQG